jgi:PAS domain S-box-containing protein
MHRDEGRSASFTGNPSLPGDDPAAAARLVALSHDLMGALDGRGRFVWTNPAWKEVLGWEPEELAGVVYSELLHPNDRPAAQNAERALVAGAGRWPEAELRVRSRSGEYRWILWSGVVALDQGLLYVSGRDVSARAERSLLYARYRALVTNLPDVIATMFDPDLRIVMTEGGALERRSLDPGAYIGRLFSETLPSDRYAELEPRLRAALAGEPQGFDFETVDGTAIYRVQAVPMHDDDGQLLGGLMVSRDVTGLRRHERAMADRAAELERSNAELANFAYVASHDLSEPLRTVSSYLQLLRRRYHGRLDEDADEFIDYAVEGAARMRTLIEDLLAYSRAGRSERPLEPVDTGSLVADAANTLRTQAEDQPPVVEWEELPTVMGDPAQLGQLFQNLIGNGVKFVAPDTRPHVRVSASREDAGWRFCVDDNGIGIDPRHAERVFGMFQRLHTRDEFPGTGIGLAIAKKVVEQHRGTIWADARPEGGSRFLFTIADPEESG